MRPQASHRYDADARASDDDSRDETQPVRPTGAAPEHAPATRRGFRERFRTWRGSQNGGRTFGLAALADVIVGGLGLAAVDAATSDDHGPGRDGWVQRHDDRGPGGPDGPGGMHGGPTGVPGQLPPTTVPEDDGQTS